ncbi:hypothetical protein X975_24467, partial [Stegodyphus mimosarum]
MSGIRDLGSISCHRKFFPSSNSNFRYKTLFQMWSESQRAYYCFVIGLEMEMSCQMSFLLEDSIKSNMGLMLSSLNWSSLTSLPLHGFRSADVDVVICRVIGLNSSCLFLFDPGTILAAFWARSSRQSVGISV